MPNNASPALPDSTSFDPPVFADALQRERELDAVHDAMRRQPVVTIGGLSGAGKTYLMAAYLSHYRQAQHFTSALWYDPSQGESLDCLLAHFSLAIPLKGQATLSRCRELLDVLASRNALLIIDDYQRVDQHSYAPLIALARRLGQPCRLVLLSQARIESLGTADEPYDVEVGGYSIEETRAVLGAHDIADDCAEDLTEKTGGLAFSVGMFCSLVRDFKRTPKELLAGPLPQASRLQNWFARMEASVGSAAKTLLPCLSLNEGTFDTGIVALLAQHAGLSDVDEAFSTLQRAHLVTPYGPSKWKVHDLVAYLCMNAMEPEEVAAVHQVLGMHFAPTATRQRADLLDAREFLDSVKAYRHLSNSNQGRDKVEAVLLQLSATAKARGHYALFVELASDARRKSRQTSPWLTYHYAHSLLILGQAAQCLKLVEPQLYDFRVIADDALRLVLTRLYAEALGSLAQETVGTAALRKALDTTQASAKRSAWYLQARSALAWLLTRLQELDEAETICDDLLVQALARQDPRAGAVAMARKATILMLRGVPGEAAGLLDTATALFRQCDDKRGQAWALSVHAECALLRRDEAAALELFAQAAQVADQIGACGVDYKELVGRLSARATQAELIALIEAEAGRLG